MQYQARIGMLLDRFKIIWEGLRSVPPGDHGSDSSNSREGPLQHFGTIRRHRVVKYRAQEYLPLFPGPHNAGSNVAFHNSLMMLLEKKEKISDSRMANIDNALRYRLSLLDQANDLVKITGLSIPDIRHFAVEKWEASWKERELKAKLWRVILDKNILDQSHPYTKPVDYICIALVESKLTWEEMLEKINFAEEYTKQRTNQIISPHCGNEIIEVIRTRDALLNTTREAPHQVKQWLTRRR